MVKLEVGAGGQLALTAEKDEDVDLGHVGADSLPPPLWTALQTESLFPIWMESVISHWALGKGMS